MVVAREHICIQLNTHDIYVHRTRPLLQACNKLFYLTQLHSKNSDGLKFDTQIFSDIT